MGWVILLTCNYMDETNGIRDWLRGLTVKLYNYTRDYRNVTYLYKRLVQGESRYDTGY